MPESFTDAIDLEALARQVGTPFWVYSAEVLQRRIRAVQAITSAPELRPRYAMKACSTRRVLEVIRAHGFWIDAVSGNEVLRAQAAGFPMGTNPPVVLLSADVFRDNAIDVVCRQRVLPNIGSPAMIDQLRAADYRGSIALRLNPGFGHGHVRATDTGGPSSKHGVWHEDAGEVRRAAERAGYPIVMLHAHIGSGPRMEEFVANMRALVQFFEAHVADYPALEAVNLGGGLPHPYRPGPADADLKPFGELLATARASLSQRARRSLRLEIEPGRFIAAPSAALVARVTDIKTTRTNDKGPGHTFVMVDAGFCDLVRPAMYGSYHHITVHGADGRGEATPVVVAGPLCESGDVFTRDAEEFLDPRPLPPLKRGDLVVVHDAGAYGVQQSSFYNSIGRAPQVWLEDGRAFLISRRETLADITRNECFEPLR